MPSLTRLVLWHTFEADKIENSKAKDRSAWENHGTLKGPTPVDGKIGKGFSFDGTDDYVDCGNNINPHLTGDLTVEVWLKPEAFGVNRGIVQTIYNSELAFTIGNTDGNLGWLQGNGVAFDALITAVGKLALNKFQHVVAVRDTTSKKINIYIDGSLTDSISYTYTPAESKEPLWIGQYHFSDKWFKGLIDELRIYDRTLSADEIKEHFQEKQHVQIREEAENLAGLWIPEISVNTSKLKDLSRWGNHGNIKGASWKWVDPGVWALEFDGIDNRVEVPDSPSLDMTDELTAMAWVNPVSKMVVGGWEGIVQKYSGVGGYMLTFPYGADTNVLLYLKSGDKLKSLSTAALPLNKWSFVAGVFRRPDGWLYLNGNLVDSFSGWDYSLTPSKSPLMMGYYNRYLEGFIGEVRVYGRAMLATEISKYFESQRSQYGV